MTEHDTTVWFHADDTYSEAAAATFNKDAQTGPHKHKVRPFREVRPGDQNALLDANAKIAGLQEEIRCLKLPRKGAITLTREELRAAMDRAYCSPGNTLKVLDPQICFAMEADLFPEGTLSNE